MRVTRRRNNLLVMELGGFTDETHRIVKRLARLPRRKSSMGLPVNGRRLMDDAPKLQTMDEEFHVMRSRAIPCRCLDCKYRLVWGSSTTGLRAYRCSDSNCRIRFESATELFEHQLDVHGTLNPRVYRFVADVYLQQHGRLALPPPTVYMWRQFMCPSRPPAPWKSLDEVHEEVRAVRRSVQEDFDARRHEVGTAIKLFEEGYERVILNGMPEVERQHAQALEHFYSAYKFQASSRGNSGGCPSVERGRNWLAQYLHPFGLNDKATEEPLFVLVDTMHDNSDEEVDRELSADEDDDDTSVNEGKSFRADDDDEMKSSDAGVVKARKVLEVESDSGDEGMLESEGNHDQDEITVKSERTESGAEANFSVENSDISSGSDDEDEEMKEESGMGKKEEEDHRSSRVNVRNMEDTESDSDGTNSGSDSNSDDENDEDEEIFNELE
ncbi:unnamed protein product [Phytophthora fragariaefolia]|uniref:Unnamed protein product n=1 Tax=Phytophthora fragariaefolia TaxID=1490495 RepID=A0A9W6TXY8_9STRA|nr:unnamed protein product [Phytophthora fragariaefolia]